MIQSRWKYWIGDDGLVHINKAGDTQPRVRTKIKIIEGWKIVVAELFMLVISSLEILMVHRI